jgi:uncharacterized coiled-coil DUF342 family protein
MSDHDDELTQAERIRRLMHRCDMEAEHVAELKEQLRASADQCRAQHQEIEALKAQRDQLRSERDEARREVLLWVKERCSWAELSDEIKKRGWDYLKEEIK